MKSDVRRESDQYVQNREGENSQNDDRRFDREDRRDSDDRRDENRDGYQESRPADQGDREEWDGRQDHRPSDRDSRNDRLTASEQARDDAHDRNLNTGQRVSASSSHQTMFVSATISAEIEKLSRQYMVDPIEKLIAPGADDKPTVEKVEQYYFSVEPWDKYRLLRLLLERENPDLAIVFCRTKRGAEKLAKKLHADGIECREIHGNLAQNKRDRVMKGFRSGKFDVLIATDLASRGIDVADISHIVNYDISEDPEVYVHRVGRTARMGATGKAFTFVTREQGDELTKVESLINMVIPQATLEGFVAKPPPSDWTDAKPMRGGGGGGSSRPVQSRFQARYGAARQSPQGGESNRQSQQDRPAESAGAPQRARAEHPVALPARNIGSKIPITRRHKRRR